MFGFGKKSGPTLGLDINSSTISVLQIEKTKTETKVSRFSSMPTPPDIVREGLLADPEAVGTSVRELLDLVGIPNKKPLPVVNVSIPGQSVVIRLMPIPTGMPDEELQDVVKQEAINNLPFPLDEANIDYCLLAGTERTDPDGVKRVDVLLAAIQRIVVESYWRMAETANIQLGRLDISSLAVIRALALSGMLHDDGQLSMAVNVRNDATDITLIKKGMPLFSRSVLLGVETLGEAISRSIDSPMDEAISLLPRINLGSVPTADPKLGQAAQVARSVFGDLIAEVGRSLEFYMSQVGIIQVDQVILTGPGCVVPGVADFVSNRLNIQAVIADPFNHLVYDRAQILDDRRPTYAMLVGLVGEAAGAPIETIQVDLNKEGRATGGAAHGEEGEEEEGQEPDTPWFVPALALGCVLAVLALGAWGVFQYMFSQKDAEWAQLDQEVTEKQHKLDHMKQDQDDMALLTAKKNALERIIKHGEPVTGLLELARETIPDGVQIIKVHLTPEQLQTTCEAVDFAHASHYAINLEGTNLVGNVQLLDLHRAQQNPQAIFFELTAAVNPLTNTLKVDEDTINNPPKPLVDETADSQPSSPAQPQQTAPVAQTTPTR